LIKSYSHHLTNVFKGMQVAPGAERTGQAQILSELSTPFTLDGLFNAADAAMDEDNARTDDEGAFTREDDMQTDDLPINGGMVVESEPISAGMKRRRSPSPSPSVQPTFNALDMTTRAPKRLRKIAARSASSPALAVVTSRRTARMERKKLAKHARRLVAREMEIDDQG
jgi:nuclear GTP-binding protein